MTRFRRLAAYAVLALVTAAGGWLVPAPASATVQRLCSGYSACSKAGMPAAGYAKASGSMYWRMYAGHNCTNYAAYRMVRSGLPNSRPWTGPGNATYWGTSMRGITDQSPSVGAVAWWRAGVYPAGSAGHVAYVEKVVSADEIVVSQDSWGGDFSWARITRSRGWPSGFVHFNDVQIVSTTTPVVSGTPKVGGVLTATPGAWSVPAVAATYRWRVGGVDVPGATGSTLALTETMLGKRVRVAVTASRLGYAAGTAMSPPTTPVDVGTIISTASPTVTGRPQVDIPLAVAPGRWNTTVDSLTYQWLADGEPMAGARATTFTPGPSQAGRTLAVRVTARRSGYADAAVTVAAPAPVAPGVLVPAGAATVAGRPRLGARLTLTSVPTATGATGSVEWLRNGTAVPGTSGASYTLTAADLGATVRARVTLRRDGYTPVTVLSPATRPVKSTTTLTVQSRRRGHARRVAVVTARATAPAVQPLTGTVRVWWRHRLLAEVPMRAGVARAVLRQLPAGASLVRVVLRSTTTTSRTEVRRRL